MKDIQTHQARPIVDELRELRDIARREHGPNAKSTRRIEAVLLDEERRGGQPGTSRRGAARDRP